MQVTKLRLVGFKSFVEPTELWVERGLTGIVGPNGCGKSNLIDALRWVMGETSARGLRGGEMDDVIFAGTAARPAHDLAEVALDMRPGDTPVAGLGVLDELQLSRRIGRGAGSAFRVNGKELRARDVQLLFADATSGARSASIVSQGQIGALVEAKPIERRRLLEEAAGVGGLQARRHEAELKLQAAEANLVRVQDRLVGLEEQHQGLQKQARQAARYRKLSAAHREAEAALLMGRWLRAQVDLQGVRESLAAGRDQVRSGSERLSAARAARERAEARLAEQRAAEARLATELARLGERLSATRDEVARLEQERARLDAGGQQAERDLEHARAGLDDARAAQERASLERRTLTADAEQAIQGLTRAEAAEAQAVQAADAAAVTLRQALARLAEVQAAIKQLSDRQSELADTRQRAAGAEARVRSEFAALGPETASTEGVDPAATAALAEATEAQAAAETGLQAADEHRETARAALEQAQGQHRASEDRLRQARQVATSVAEQRQGLTTRRAELATRLERLALRQDELASAVAAADGARAGLDLAGLASAEAAARRRLDEAEALVAERRSVLAAASEAEGQAHQHLRQARAGLDRLEAEARALAELAGPDGEQPSLAALLEVDEDHAEALAAALGDDLIGSLDAADPCHWRVAIGAEPAPAAPPLPVGCRPLAEVVTAPAALRRRLTQVGVADAASADQLQAALAQGQRLVDPDGGLWRWDGFVRRAQAGERSSARLRQATRRRQLQDLLADAGASVAAAERGLEAATVARETAAEAAAAVEQARTEARAALEAAREQRLQAEAQAGALTSELDGLARQQAAAAAEREEIEAADTTLEGELDALPADAPAASLADLEAADAAAAAVLSEAAAVEQKAAAAQALARQRLTSAREQAGAARAALEAAEVRARKLEAERRQQALTRAQLEATLTRLGQEQADLERQAGVLAAALATASADLPTAEAAMASAEATLAEARERQATVSAERARLVDQRDGAARRIAVLEEDCRLWSGRQTSAEQRIAELGERRTELAAALTQLDARPDHLATQRAEIERQIAEMEARRRAIGAELAQAETALSETQTALEQAEALHMDARESGARLEERIASAEAEVLATTNALRSRFGPETPLPVPARSEDGGAPEPPTAEELTGLASELARIEAARERLGPVNLRAIDEAEELALTIQDLDAEQTELTAAIERLRRAIQTLNREGRERLRAAFATVETHFEALFARLFGGGRARLTLTDLDDPLNAGLELYASPPGKKLQSISLLSGGEKALTTLALIFAVFLTRPSPLCVLDEVDAPLDDANVARLGELLQELAAGTDTRFLIVTHHPLTMARMDRLYGVTMAERGISQLVSVDLGEAEELRATA